MTDLQQKMSLEGMTRGVKATIVVMLLLLLIPTAFVSVPTARIKATVTNMDDERTATVSVRVYGGGDEYYDFYLAPGEHATRTFHVKAGTYEAGIHFTYPDDHYYGNFSYAECTVWWFETGEVAFLIPY